LQIVYKKDFLRSLDAILDYIALDSLNKALNFNRQLQSVIDNIPNMPYKYRKSFYYDDENIRDMVFKGYTIPYLVDEDKDLIVLFDIFKWVHK
jgi:plasmid stabilization system protein ParE